MIIVKGRELLIPENERYIGTTYDDNSTVRTFRIPRFHEDGMDKSQLDFYVIINYDDGSEPDAVGVTKSVSDDYIVLEWDVGEDITEHAGCLFLWVRGFDYTGAVRWSSFPGVFYIEGSGTEPSDLSDLEQRISEEDKLIRLAKLYKSQPMTAATVAEMKHRDRIYVYVGNEAGYTYGNWYFWDEDQMAWVSGGVYNSVGIETDKTLTLEDFAADAAVTGKIKNAFVFPEWFGAKGDGTTNDTTAFQAAINYCAENGGEVKGYNKSQYLITAPLSIPYAHPVNINGCSCTIIVGADIATVFDIGTNPTGRDYDAGRQKPQIHHLKVTNDGTHLAQYLAKIAIGVKDYEFHNIISENTVNGMKLGDSSRMIPGDIQIHDCIFYGNGAEYDSCGFDVYLSDDVFDNVRVYGFQRGFDFHVGAIVINVHVLIRWHNQSIDNFSPYEYGGTEWNTYFPLTCFARIYTQASIPMDTCYCDGMHTFLVVYTEYARINVTNLIHLGHSAANAGGSDVIDLTNLSGTQKNINININGALISYASTNRASYGIKVGEGYISRFSQVSMSDIHIIGYPKMANAADPILAGTTRLNQKFTVFTANKWMVIGCVANVPNNFRGMFHITMHGNPFELEMDMQGGAVTFLKERGMNDQTDWTFGFWYSSTYKAIFICAKTASSPTINTNVELHGYSANSIPFLALPCYAASGDRAEPYWYSLPLSDLTSDEPSTSTITKPMNNATVVTQVFANQTFNANTYTDLTMSFNAGRDVNCGIFMLNAQVNGLSVATAYSISRTSCHVRIYNSTSNPITVGTLRINGFVFNI